MSILKVQYLTLDTDYSCTVSNDAGTSANNTCQVTARRSGKKKYVCYNEN